MNYDDLLIYLGLEDGSEFQYFETMADLVECEEYIEQEAMWRLFTEADATTVSGLIDDYFEEIINGLPDDSGEIYSLLEQIRLCLAGLIINAEDASDIRMFTDEFYRFRSWYSEESEVELISEEVGTSDYICLRDAITAARMETLGGERYRYNFENALNYEVDSYTMSFADLIATEDDYNEGYIIETGEENEP